MRVRVHFLNRNFPFPIYHLIKQNTITETMERVISLMSWTKIVFNLYAKCRYHINYFMVSPQKRKHWSSAYLMKSSRKKPVICQDVCHQGVFEESDQIKMVPEELIVMILEGICSECNLESVSLVSLILKFHECEQL